jgi:integrase
MITMIEKYLQDQQVNGLAKHTLKTEASCLKRAGTYKSLSETWKKEDVNGFIMEMQKEYSDATVETYKIILRKFFKWSGQPAIIAHLKSKRVNNNINRDDLLTTDDINKLIESTRNPKYKAMVAFLYESGGRIQEVLSVNVKDVQTTDKGIVVSVPQTKTGNDYRRVLCVLSGQYLMNWIAYGGLKPDDVLFKLHKANAWRFLIKAGKGAGISKPCNPHAFRHAQATNMLQLGYNESIIRKKLGWTGDSKMIGRYVHCVDDDVIDATVEKNGTPIQKPQVKNINPAQAVSIVDTASTIAKVNAENAVLKERLDKKDIEVEELKAMFNKDVLKVMIEARVHELMKQR